MHTDARELPAGHVLQGDVCIVGAGAAGIAAAHALLGSGLSVLLLEGGGFDLEGPIQGLYRGEIVGRPYYPLEASRLHYFGGTTGHWGGYCSPLDDIDFTHRSWVPDSGWPISRADLDAWYARAHPLLDLDAYRYDVAHWIERDARRERLPLDPRVVRDKVWQFSPPTRFGSKFRDPIVRAANVHLYTHANVVEVLTTPDATRVTAVRVRHFDGREFTAQARHFVLACSTMQNVRLLLASSAHAPAGLGNAYDQVGRRFLEHLEMPVGEVVMTRPQSMALYAYDFGITRMRAELQLTDEQQATLGVLNTTMALEAPQEGPMRSTFQANPPDEMESYRQATRDSLGADMRGESRDYSEARVRANPRLSAIVRQEQAPNSASRVTIGRERDALGVPRVRFDWQLNALDKHTMRTVCVALAREFGRAGVGRMRLERWVLDDNHSWPDMVSGGWHDLGATRMHASPRHGVVNADCRVHGIHNLFLAGGGVFSTAAAANPTLTIVALALRLAGHIERNT